MAHFSHVNPSQIAIVGGLQTTMADYRAVILMIILRTLHQNKDVLQHYWDQQLVSDDYDVWRVCLSVPTFACGRTSNLQV